MCVLRYQNHFTLTYTHVLSAHTRLHSLPHNMHLLSYTRALTHICLSYFSRRLRNHTHTYPHTHIHIYTYKHTHTYTHAHTRTHTSLTLKATKSIFKANDAILKWNMCDRVCERASECALLIQTSTLVDASNQSFYGESGLLLMHASGKFQCSVPFGVCVLWRVCAYGYVCACVC